MLFVVPDFELEDIARHSLNEHFLLRTRLGNHRAISQYSDGVQLATRMLTDPDDRKVFVQICQILAFSEMGRGNSQRIRPIGWTDIRDLNTLSRELQ